MTTEATAAVEERPQPGQVYWRQLDILNPEKLNEFSFVIVGAGSTGSWSALVLAKLGARHITVWDHDVINEHNAPCQVYSTKETGQRKVNALTDHVACMTSTELFPMSQKLDKEATPVFDKNTVLVLCVDNMAARKYCWELAKACPDIRLVIDPRLAREVLRFYAVDPQDPQQQAFYEANLYTDEEADEESIPCTAQAIIYTATFTASFVASIVSSFINGTPFPNEGAFDTRSFRFVGDFL